MKWKYAFILPIFLCFAMTGFAQMVNTVPFAEIDSEYIRVYEIRIYPSSGRTNVKVDYGQKSNNFKERWLRDEAGDLFDFNSIVDMLNFMHKYGYILLETTVEGENTSVTEFIFRKE